MYCGCEPSKLDGTEHILQIANADIPEEFSWENVMPKIRNQGATQTCVCQTLTGILDYKCNEIDYTPGRCHNFSIDELYNARANKRVEGMSIKEALHYLRHTGLGGQKIESYSKINDIETLKYAILMFGPCAAGLPCYTADQTHFWRKGGKFCGGHCITFVGYTKTGFIIRNSWGTQWGNNGYVEMPYKEFGTSCFEVWCANI